MRRLLAFTVFFAILSTVRPAEATPIDPFIGVRGVDAGSEPSDSSAFFQMEGCPSDLNEEFGSDRVFCLEYDIVQDLFGIFSMTFQFKDNDGLIPNDFLFPDGTFNGFDGFERLEDGFSVRFFLSGEFNFLQCPIGESEEFAPCGQGSTVQVFLWVPLDEPLNDPYFARLLAINDVAIPEPGTLALLGLGIAAVAGRRLRRRPS